MLRRRRGKAKSQDFTAILSPRVVDIIGLVNIVLGKREKTPADEAVMDEICLRLFVTRAHDLDHHIAVAFEEFYFHHFDVTTFVYRQDVV